MYKELIYICFSPLIHIVKYYHLRGMFLFVFIFLKYLINNINNINTELFPIPVIQPNVIKKLLFLKHRYVTKYRKRSAIFTIPQHKHFKIMIYYKIHA